MEEKEYKYYAFISYNYKDAKWGKRLQRKLEGYRMPATICNEHGWQRKPIRPIFFAPTDIQPGELSAELQERLKASRNLIVICSPNSAQSSWVGNEIAFFHSLGRANNIHFFIIDGIPHSGNVDTECFNSIIETLDMPEILGANIHEKINVFPWINRERAYVQIITKLLGIEFDSIWLRHKRLLKRAIAAYTAAAIAVLSIITAVWIYNQPLDVSLFLKESSTHNDSLPPLNDAVIILSLDNESKTETLSFPDSVTTFRNIPSRFLGKPARIIVNCPNWIPIDTVMTITESMSLNFRRDPLVYGNVNIRIWDPNAEKFIPDVVVSIAGIETTSDKDGRVKIFIPLEKQAEQYTITCSVPLVSNILEMPTTESSCIIVDPGR